MRTLALAAYAFLWMCGSDDPPVMPPAEHGGVVLSVGAQPLEVVAHADGAIEAYPLAASTARGPTTSVIVHVPSASGTVVAAPLAWDEPSGKFIGTMGVAPAVGAIEVDAVIAGAPQHAAAPVFVVLAPSVPVVIGTAPARVEVIAPPPVHARVDVVAPGPPSPVVVVEPPRPGVIIVPPGPPVPPAVVLVGPRPPRPGVVIVEPPRPGIVVVEPPRPGVVIEGGGHWDHGRHGHDGPRGEWHVGGGGHGGGGHGGGHGRGR